MKNDNFRRSRFSIILPIGLLFLLFIFSQWHPIKESIDCQPNTALEDTTTGLQDLNEIHNKQRGAHVFGRLDSTNYQHLIQNNLEWITLVEWGNQDKYDSPLIRHHNGDSLNILRSNANWIQRIKFVQSAGFKVFLKPHIWVVSPSTGKWRTDIYPANEENWELWKKSYRDYIIRFAIIAEQANVEMFCIGTELSRLTVEKPVFWKELIQEVRSIYSGKITYAANWYKEYEKITFWEELDYIGIQAYFPLVKDNYPTVEQISKGWKKYFPEMESIHEKYNRKILFTEMGYKSTANSAAKPWEWLENSPEQDKLLSTETQANCYEAFFNTVWKKEWFAGVHIWQLRSDYVEGRNKNNLNFTPQGKPAETIIVKGFE